jgi:predicted esterase
MRLVLFGFILSITLIIPACNKWQEWEQILVNKESKYSSENNQETNSKSIVDQESKPEPLLSPGEYNFTAPKANVPFIVYVPLDYVSDHSFPVIFCYHGLGATATTWPFYQVTHGKGFIIVGMNYSSQAAEHLGLEFVRFERALFLEALQMVSARLNVDQKLIFMGGYSQGGYSTSLLGEQVIDKLAGLIILGAGRYAVDHYPPLPRSIRDKPIFIGVGQNDSVHNSRARLAANTYLGWGASVTFEEWAGFGHNIDTLEFPSKKLLPWLEGIVAKRQAQRK